MNITEITKKTVARHREKGWAMDYVLPLEKETRCVVCGELAPKDMEVIHRMSSFGTVDITCSEKCYMLY